MAKKETLLLDKNYKDFLRDIKSKIISARISAARRINKELIKLYWDIGKVIVERQEKYGWGRSVIEKLEKDLKKEFGNTKGFSSRNLWYMRCFYLEYKAEAILQQPVAELPWGHNILIFTKVKDRKAREYYIKSAIELGWSRNVLLNQVKANAYKMARIAPKQHNFPKALPVHLAEQADESLKSVYNLDFLGITQPVLERELENRLYAYLHNSRKYESYLQNMNNAVSLRGVLRSAKDKLIDVAISKGRTPRLLHERLSESLRNDRVFRSIKHNRS